MTIFMLPFILVLASVIVGQVEHGKDVRAAVHGCAHDYASGCEVYQGDGQGDGSGSGGILGKAWSDDQVDEINIVTRERFTKDYESKNIKRSKINDRPRASRSIHNSAR